MDELMGLELFMFDEARSAAKNFYILDVPKKEFYFYSGDIVVEGETVPAQLAANRCIKVTFEYSDIPE
jgi:hypothetical protein